MKYNVDEIVKSAFDLDDLYHYPELRDSILSLLSPTCEKIKSTRDLLASTALPWNIEHHLKIRLELLEDIIKFHL